MSKATTVKKVATLGIKTSPESSHKVTDKFSRKANSVRNNLMNQSYPEMTFDIQGDMKRERDRLNRVLHIKEKSLMLGQQQIE